MTHDVDRKYKGSLPWESKGNIWEEWLRETWQRSTDTWEAQALRLEGYISQSVRIQWVIQHLSCEHRTCELLGHCNLFRTPCGPVSLPPAVCKAPQPCVEVCWCCLLAKAYKLQSKLDSFCWYLSHCRPQLNSCHVSLGCKSSCLFAGGLLSSEKRLHCSEDKRNEPISLPPGRLDGNCVGSVCILVPTSPNQSFILSGCCAACLLLFHWHCSMYVFSVSLVLLY